MIFDTNVLDMPPITLFIMFCVYRIFHILKMLTSVILVLRLSLINYRFHLRTLSTLYHYNQILLIYEVPHILLPPRVPFTMFLFLMRVLDSLGYIFSHLSLRFPLFFYNSNFLQQIKSDNTKDFLSLIKMLRSFGITHRLTCPHTPTK